MRVVEALILVAVLAGAMLAVFLVGRGMVGAVTGARGKHRPWAVTERSDGTNRLVYVARPGEEPYLIGAVPVSHPDFNSEIEHVRAEARLRLVALNQPGG